MSTDSDSSLYDAFIPFHEKDADILPYCLDALRKNAIGLRTIFIISERDPEEPDCVWVSESVFPNEIQWGQKSGWYYQQLLKLYCFRILGDRCLPHVLLFDSDIIITTPTPFLNNRAFFDLGSSYFHCEEYIDHMQKLFKGEVKRYLNHEFSEIVDYMIVERNILEEMLSKIETLHGVPASKALLDCVKEQNRTTSGMSEYTLYFNYVMTFHPSRVKLRLLRRKVCSSIADLSYANDYTILIFHSWCQGKFDRLEFNNIII
jgi:hypothetical protein